MTPDENICTTCKGEGAVVWCKRVNIRTEERPASEGHVRLCRMGWGDTLRVGDRASDVRPWGVDACPECGRGREVGRL